MMGEGLMGEGVMGEDEASCIYIHLFSIIK